MKKNLLIANREKFKVTELKTLEDFPFSEILINDLRREAIKWLKSTDPRMNMPQDLDGWIKHFFNITEENL